MASVAEDLEHRTVLPPEPGTPQADRLRQLSDLLFASREPTQHARLVGPDGAIELPPELYSVIRAAVHALLAGRGITIQPHTAMLSTQEAADLLGISRPTLVKLLEAGEIPYDQLPGQRRHRRVQLAAVEAYRQRSRRRRRAALRELTRDADAQGLYEAGTGFVDTR
jgi:excisionase family DNA binding protein